MTNQPIVPEISMAAVISIVPRLISVVMIMLLVPWRKNIARKIQGI